MSSFKLFLNILYKTTPVLSQVDMKLPFVIGSGDKADLRILNDKLSAMHLQIYQDGGNVRVKDLTGKNSIRFNGNKVNDFVVLDDEFFQVFDFLDCEIGFHMETEVAVDPGAKTQVTDLSSIDKTEISLSSSMANSDTVFDLSEEEMTVITQANIAAPRFAEHLQAYTYASPITNFERSPLLSSYKPSPQLRKRQLALEANLFWKNKLLQSKQLEIGDRLIVGPGYGAGIEIPYVQQYREVAVLGKNGLKLNVASNLRCGLHDLETNTVKFDTKWNKSVVSLSQEQQLEIQFDADTSLYLRSIPSTRPLTDKKVGDHNYVILESFLSSGIIHILILLLALFNAQEVTNIPVVENVPKRYAKLLVKEKEAPKPEPPKPEEPKPEPPKKVEKKPEPPKKEEPKPAKKIEPKPVVRKPKPVEVKKQEKNTLNKYPLKLDSKTVKDTNTQKVAQDSSKVETNQESFGALGALLAVKSPSTETASININKEAGGPASDTPSSSDMMANLKTATGKLSGGSVNRVSTKGTGVGDGSAYGVQGLGGSAGKAGVAGSIGRPEVSEFGKQEGLSLKEVMAIVNKHIAKIQRCYEKALIADSGLSGRAEYEWVISAAGSVQSARVSNSELKGDGGPLNTCVMGVIKNMKFPAAKNGQSTQPKIGFPFGRF